MPDHDTLCLAVTERQIDIITHYYSRLILKSIRTPNKNITLGLNVNTN